MKIRFLILLLLFLTFSIISCGSGKKTSDSKNSAETPDSGDSAEETQDEDTDAGNSTHDADEETPEAAPDEDETDPDDINKCEEGSIQCMNDYSLYVCEKGFWKLKECGENKICRTNFGGCIETRSVDCTGLPENASWYTAESITQYLIGEEWLPSSEESFSLTPSTVECRFRCNIDYTWNNSECVKIKFPFIDLENNLMWSASTEPMLWENAMAHCDNLQLGNFNDWHMPTISELKTVFKNCPNMEEGGKCGISDDCLALECLGTNGEDCLSCGNDSWKDHGALTSPTSIWLWSSSPVEGYIDEVFGMNAFSGSMYVAVKNDLFNTRCARTICSEGFYWNDIECVESPARTESCSGLPENAEWNTVSAITQTWNGISWKPSSEGVYSEEASETKCVFKCKSGYGWIESECTKLPWKDPESGLTWSNPVSNKTWAEATEYCKKLKEEGVEGWRLPTIDELRTLVKNCSSTETDGSCTVTDSCPGCINDSCNGCTLSGDGKYSKLGDTLGLWSSTPLGDSADKKVWGVYFGSAAVQYSDKSENGNVRCVK